jgi:hypothetical protein
MLFENNSRLRETASLEGLLSKTRAGYSSLKGYAESAFGDYNSFMIKHKTISTFKNMVLSSLTFMATGYYGSKLMSSFTDNNRVNAGVTIAFQGGASFAVFLKGRKDDNQDIYYDSESKFKRGQFWRDNGRLFAALAIPNLMYAVGKPFAHYKFMNLYGMSHANASLVSDILLTPIYCAIALPFAKMLGGIRTVNTE